MSENAAHPSTPIGNTLIIGGAILAVLGLRLLGLDKGLWLDEIFSIEAAANVSVDGLRASDKPPLYVLLLSGWTTLGTSDTYLRLLSVGIAFVTLVTLARWLGRTSVLAALVGILLFGTLPMLLRYGQEVRGYGLSLLLATIAFERSPGFTGAVSERGRAWLVGVVCALGVATHLIGVFLVAPVLLYALASVDRGRRRAVLLEIAPRIVLPPAIAFAAFYFAFLDRIPTNADWWMPTLTPEVLLRTMEELFGLGVIAQLLEGAGVAGARVGGVLLGVTLFAVLLLAGGRAGVACLAAALLYWTQLGLVSLIGTPIFLYRTALLGLVPLIAFASLQTANARGALRWASLAGIAVACLAFTYAWTTRLAGSPYEQWRDLGTLIARSPATSCSSTPRRSDPP